MLKGGFERGYVAVLLVLCTEANHLVVLQNNYKWQHHPGNQVSEKSMRRKINTRSHAS